MKKITAVLLSVSVLISLFSGCANNSSNKPSGKELAKLLLANERLDSSVFENTDETLDFLKLSTDNKPSSGFLKYSGKTKLTAMPLAYFDGNTFKEECNMLSFFQSYIENILFNVDSASALIDKIKEDVNRTDVWIPDFANGGDRVLLSVDANEEVCLQESAEAICVCRRYTDQNGDNVYEIYRKETEGLADSYLLYIPDKKYEFSLFWKDQISDNLHIVIENTRGYWNMFVTTLMDDEYGKRANVQNLISTGESTYANYSTVFESGYEYDYFTTFTDKNRICDVLAVEGVNLQINIAAFNGISSVTTEDGNLVTDFTTSSGKTIKPQDSFLDGKVSFVHGAANDNGDNNIYGNLSFSFDGELSYKEKANLLNTVLTELGISCKYDMMSLVANIPAAIQIAENFDNYYAWNGYLVNNYSNLKSAESIGAQKNQKLIEEYESRKNNEEIKLTDNVLNSNDVNFAAISSLTAESVSLIDNKVVVSGLNATIDDLSLFDNGEAYSVRLALAKQGDDEEYSSAIILSGENAVNTIYNSGDSFTLTQNAEFTLPDCDELGTYTVTAYVATADGIRVSEMIPLPFTSDVSYSGTTKNGISYSFSLNESKEAIAVYEAGFLVFNLAEKQEGYTYEELNTEINNLILNHGYPIDGAVLEEFDPDTEESHTANSASTFKSAICRMKFSDQATNTEKYAYVIIP